jgi:hypothetical protein
VFFPFWDELECPLSRRMQSLLHPDKSGVMLRVRNGFYSFFPCFCCRLCDLINRS